MEGVEVTKMKRILVVLFFLSLSVSISAVEKESVMINFEGDKTGDIPIGFKGFHSGIGPDGKWEVIVDETAQGPSKVLAQTSDEDLEYHFPILIYDGLSLSDGVIKVSFRSISGRRDRAAGIVFRFQDPDNYYVLRANALEDNLDLYKYKKGKRKKIAWKDVRVPSREWHTIKVECRGSNIQGYYDDKLLIDVKDDTYKTGKVGLWTKADSVIHFDNLLIEPLD